VTLEDDNTMLTAFRTRLADNGVRVVGMTFDGCGDEGHIGDFVFPRPEHRNKPLDMLDMPILVTHPWEEEQLRAALALSESYPMFSDWTLNMLDTHFDGDWVNNDGGGGTLWLDVISGAFYLDGYQHYTSSTAVTAQGCALPPIASSHTAQVTALLFGDT
jgi:hypothetical protein